MSEDLLFELRQVKDIFRESYGITRIAIFGSYA